MAVLGAECFIMSELHTWATCTKHVYDREACRTRGHVATTNLSELFYIFLHSKYLSFARAQEGGDGCSAECAIEEGFACEPSASDGPPSGPTVGLCLGTFGGPGGGYFLISEVPLHMWASCSDLVYDREACRTRGR